MTTFSRRQFLKATAAAGAAVSFAGWREASATPPPPGADPVYTFAHLTDIHLKPEGPGREQFIKCLAHVHAHPARPAAIFNGGDTIMSALGATAERTREQWTLYHEVIASHNTLPWEHCIGNHDCWGWQRSKAGTTGDEPLYGKAWALQEMKLAARYRSFDRAGWHFIILDSVQERGDEGYKPVLDEEQFAWLEQDLAQTPASTPTLILSHVPIMSVTPFFFVDNIVEDYNFKLIGALMHQDVLRLRDALRNGPATKLCLSGHCHLLDRVDYEGVTYLCNGAVSGNWWGGPYKNCPPGYALMKLYENGAFEREYIDYAADTAGA